MSDTIPNDNRFWQVNLGHVLTMFTVIGSLAFMYGQVATRLENQQQEIVTLQQTSVRLEASMGSMQISAAAADQDRIDLHKTIEDDFSRRLAKLEDKVK